MRLNQRLIDLAEEVVNSGEKQIEFNPGEDYQGELSLSWSDGKFQAILVIFSDPHTSWGGYYTPPETTWREEEEELVTPKISKVDDFVKSYGFSLMKP